MNCLATGFLDPDGDETGNLEKCLSAIHNIPFFSACKEESFRLLGIMPGKTLLEAGCGTGEDALALARRVGPGGKVLALDISRRMTYTTRRLGMYHGMPIEAVRMDAGRLAVRDRVVEGARIDRVLQHIPSPHRAIQEIHRVLVPGGRLVVFEPDWETFTLDGGAPELTRCILTFWQNLITNGWIGRSLIRMHKQAGFVEVAVQPRTLILTEFDLADRIFDIRRTADLVVQEGVLPGSDVAAWVRDLEKSDREGLFFCSLTLFLVTSVRP